MTLIIDNISSEGNLSASTLNADTGVITNLVVTNITGVSTTDYYVTGGTFSSSTLTLNRNGLSDVTITGFTDYYVTGGTYSSGTLTLNRNGLSNVTITGLNSGTVTGTGVANKVTYWSDTSGITYNNNFHWDNTNERLGIGTSSPDAKLTVVSNEANAYPVNSGTTQTGFFTRFRNVGSNLVLDMGGNSGNGNWLQSTNQTNLSLTYPLLLNPNGGNVGIGTTTPVAPLQVLVSAVPSLGEEIVRFSVSDDTNSFLRIYNSTNTNATYIPTLEGKNSTNSVALITIGNGTTDTGSSPLTIFDSRIGSLAVSTRPLFQWRNFGTSQMTMIANGNLGIGVASPTEKLHVAGNALITGTTFTSNLNVTGGTGINWISGSTSTDMLRVTQTGSGNAFVVEDDTNPDATPFVITSLGNVGVGTTTFDGTNPEKFVVTPSNQNAIVAKGPIAGFMQLNIQNTSNSTSASADVVATNDTGNDTNNYIDMGINSSTYSASGGIGTANDSYLYNIGRELWIGNATTGTTGNIRFFAGSVATATTMTIAYTERVGIGTTSPNEKLHIVGNNLVSGTISGSTLTITSAPTLNNANTQILTRNSTSGNIEYSSAASTAFYPYGIGFAQSIGNYLT